MLYGIRTGFFVWPVTLALAFHAFSQTPDLQTSRVQQAEQVSGLIKSSRRSETTKTDVRSVRRSINIARAILFNNYGARYAKVGDYERALIDLQRASELDPSSAAIQLNTSIVLDHLKRYDEAIVAAQNAVTANSAYIPARIQLCDLMLMVERNRDAVNCYEKLKELGHLAERVIGNYGVSLMRTNQLHKAAEVLKAAVAAQPYNVAPLNELGVLHFREKRYKEAAAAFKQASEIDPRNVDIRYNLGITQLMVGNKPGAISQYRFLSELSPQKARKLYRIIYRDKILFVNDN